MRILRQKGMRRAMQVGEIAPPTAGDPYFLARGPRVIDQQNRSARVCCAHHPRGSGSYDRDIDLHGRLVTRNSQYCKPSGWQ
jgi:hypothetical protein